jgi:[acyl-carrier-protein] S-malonyltransferase
MIMTRTVYLFPGLGGYLPGALSKLMVDHPATAKALEPVDQAAREHGLAPLTPVLTDPGGPEIEDLARTPVLLHLAALGIGIGVHAVLRAEGFASDLVLGHSTGEMTALAAAGCLSAYDAARVLCEREKALTELDSGGGLVALEVGEVRAGHLCGATGDPTLELSLFNAPRQTVVSGRADGLTSLEKVARAAGVRASRLLVRYPHHSPLLAPAARRMSEATADIELNPARCRVYSPLLGGFVRGPDDIRRIIDRHLTDPVRYFAAISRLYAHEDVGSFVEVGARALLTDFVTLSLPADVRVAAPLRVPVGLTDLMNAVDARPTTKPTDVPATKDEATVAPSQNGTIPAPRIVPQPAATEPSPPEVALPTPERLLAELRELFADTLGYPLDVFTEDAHLEADLGVASVRKTELLITVLDRYDLPTPTSEIRIRDYNTLPKLVDLVYQLAGRDPARATTSS